MKNRRRTSLLIVMFIVPFIESCEVSAAAPEVASPTIPEKRMKLTSDLTYKQEPMKVNQDILNRASVDPLSIVVSLSKQRVYLQVGGWTPKGEFCILEKDPNHQSNLYGDLVDEGGRKVRSGISSKLVSPPGGTHFQGASMKYFMRLTTEGVGMHAGILPGYPASHGCIRLPLEAAKMIYSIVGVSTPVTVAD